MFGILLVIGYLILVLLPLSGVALPYLKWGHGFVYNLGRCFALSALLILAMQPILSARFKWLTAPFGLDIVSRFHKFMAIFAAVLLICHPFLLAIGSDDLTLVTSLNLPWNVLLGKIVLILLLIQVGLYLYWRRIGLTFEKWRVTHYLIAPAILVGAQIHSWVTGFDEAQYTPYKVLWIIVAAAWGSAFVYHKVIKPRALARRPFAVSEVQPETHNVWTVTLEPPAQTSYEFLPGQFHFITFVRDPYLPVEEHHWTISSSPLRPKLSSTIKESGDFTATIGRTKPGDKAIVEGPFGRFSYVLHPEDRDLVFIAGGIGITPFMAMIRHMKDSGKKLPLLLLYANRTGQNIVFRDELEEIEAEGTPDLRVIHVLSQPDEKWPGETGYITGDLIERHCGPNLASKTFYICGPPVMADNVVSSLRDRGVPYSRIRSERFSL